jgi:hypothetical protein
VSSFRLTRSRRKTWILTLLSSRFDKGDVAFIIIAAAMVCLGFCGLLADADYTPQSFFMVPGLGELCIEHYLTQRVTSYVSI